MTGYRKDNEIANVHAFRHEDESYFYLTVELHNGFSIQATLCKDTGQVRCELWDERNSLTQDHDDSLDAGLRMTPYEFLEWREVASGREPREYLGAHYRATHEAPTIEQKTVEEIEAIWEVIRREEEATKTPEQRAAEREAWAEKYAAEKTAREKKSMGKSGR